MEKGKWQRRERLENCTGLSWEEPFHFLSLTLHLLWMGAAWEAGAGGGGEGRGIHRSSSGISRTRVWDWVSLAQGKEAASIGQAWRPEQFASGNADSLSQDTCGALPCLLIPGEEGHPW